MTIKFVCSCGKRMKARDEMAGRRSQCPRCGEPVGIPGGNATYPDGSPGPLSPQDRRRLQSRKPTVNPALLRGPVPDIPPPPDPLTAVTPVLPPGVRLSEAAAAKRKPRPALRSRRAWHLETHWSACLTYPFRAYALVLAFGVLLALDSVFVVSLLPRIQNDLRGSPEAWSVLAGILVPSALLIGYVCGFLDCVLASGAAGEAGTVSWPGRNLVLVGHSLAIWLIAFIAGPAVLAAGAYYYWLQAGDLERLDKVILAEMGFLTFGYWLFVLASVNQRERLADVSPFAVARLIDEFGFRAWGLALAASVLGVLHLLGVLHGLARLSEDPVPAFALLLASWISGLYWATFLMRLLGVWSYWSRSEKAKSGRSSQTLVSV